MTVVMITYCECQKIRSVTCMVFICFIFFYLVSVDPDIGDIDGK